jgi:hypothetical protein
LWSDASAYFNGNAVLLELVAAPGTTRNRVSLDRVARENGAIPVGGGGECGICGSDDRVPSNELWSARLLPAGCTASVYNTNSCLVSAGHCISGGMVIQFDVPASNPNCSLNHPPIEDQFPITSSDAVNGGVGNDWSVLVSGVNNLGELPFARYGEMRPIASSPGSFGQTVTLWGYGVDNTCVNSQVQQTSSGTITAVGSTWYEFNVDLRGGNSGSGLMRNDEIIGVVTHCSFGCPNFATRVDLSSFANAIDDCGIADCPGTGDCCQANGTPGCEDVACCELVCACDPFCCDTEWDEACATDGVGGGGCGAEVLCDCGGGAQEAPLTTFSVKRGNLISGNLSSLQDSDDDYVQIDAVLNGNGNQYITVTQIDANSPFTTVSRLDLTTEVGVDVAANSAKTRIQLRNWTTNSWDTLDQYSQGTSDTVQTYQNIANPDDYIRDNNNRIRVRIQTKIRTSYAPNGYVARIDHVEVDVTE